MMDSLSNQTLCSACQPNVGETRNSDCFPPIKKWIFLPRAPKYAGAFLSNIGDTLRVVRAMREQRKNIRNSQLKR